jgi:hypothetical protein
MSPNSSCAIILFAFTPPSARCEEGLRELERRGYPIRRARGFSAIDQGRNQMASDALHDGLAETMWIDSDIGFTADAVERLRSHDLPIVAGLYPQPGGRSLACHLLPGTGDVVFGEQGGLLEIKYAAAGFLYVRRDALLAIRDKLALPQCNTRFGRGLWPFFMPLTVEEPEAEGREPVARGQGTGDGGQEESTAYRYLTEDFAFCHRARQAGFKIMADTTIRLWRTGSYSFGWEDAGSDAERFDTFHFHVE